MRRKSTRGDNVEVGGKDVGVKCYLYLLSCERAQVDGSGPASRTQCNTQREFKPTDYFIYYYKQPIIRTEKGQTARRHDVPVMPESWRGGRRGNSEVGGRDFLGRR